MDEYFKNWDELKFSIENIKYFNVDNNNKNNTDSKLLNQNKNLEDKLNKLTRENKFLKKKFCSQNDRKLKIIINNILYLSRKKEIKSLKKEYIKKKEIIIKESEKKIKILESQIRQKFKNKTKELINIRKKYK
jgi:hypothetical protein